MSPPPNPERAAERRAVSPVLRAEDFRPLSSTVRVQFGAHSDGRPRNAPADDHYLVVRLGRSQETVLTSLMESDVPHRFTEYGYAMVLADGLGGTAASGLASRVAVATLVHLALHYGRWNVRVDARAAFEIIERLDWCYGRANEVVKQRAKTSHFLEGMATKVTAAYSAGDELFVAHAGRSLAYVFREGRLLTLSPENTTAAEPPARPRPVNHDDTDLSHVLSDAIGGPGRLMVSVDRFQLHDGDTLMLCTDGLTATLSEDQIADTLADRRSPADLAHRLIDQALDARSVAGVSVLLAQYRIPGRVVSSFRSPFEA
jgi:protein phosphatase